MAVLRVEGLPDDPLAASALFHARFLPQALDIIGTGVPELTLVFPPAPHEHTDWRKAAVATLARVKAPVRINAVASAEPPAITRALAWLDAAPAITGHYLILDSHGAGSVAI